MAKRKRKKPLTLLEKMLRSDGALCATFVNTASGKRKALESYEDLLAWAPRARVVANGVATLRARYAVVPSNDEDGFAAAAADWL